MTRTFLCIGGPHSGLWLPSEVAYEQGYRQYNRSSGGRKDRKYSAVMVHISVLADYCK